MPLFLLRGVDGGLEVPRIVKRVEDTDDVDAVGNRLLHKVFDHIVGIVTVAKYILASEKHLQLCFLPVSYTHLAEATHRLY